MVWPSPCRYVNVDVTVAEWPNKCLSLMLIPLMIGVDVDAGPQAYTTPQILFHLDPGFGCVHILLLASQSKSSSMFEALSQTCLCLSLPEN